MRNVARSDDEALDFRGVCNLLVRLLEIAVKDAKDGDEEALDFVWLTAPDRAEIEGLPAIASEDAPNVGGPVLKGTERNGYSENVSVEVAECD